jgi:hypothetical protein
MPRPAGSKNKLENNVNVDIVTYTNKIAELENQLLLERATIGNLTIKLAEAEQKYNKIRKRCANVETQLLKKK